MSHSERRFTDVECRRERVPIFVGLIGPTASGKTFSGLRLATGMKRVLGGEIFVIDTESKRSSYYANDFQFRRVDFAAPFSPLDYLAALEHCKSKGASVVVVDSMSHEHEGPGGVMEIHQEELMRLSGGDEKKMERVKMLAWSKPKQMRQRLLNSIQQLGMSAVFCFRAKEKIAMLTAEEKEELRRAGEKPEAIRKDGILPIGGDEFPYEMTVNCILRPGSEGVPQWDGLSDKQILLTKRAPRGLRHLFAEAKSLDEQIGEEMAKWARGDGAIPVPTAASKTLAPGATTTDNPAFVAGVKALRETLTGIGKGTDETRLVWISDVIGRPIARYGELTMGELDTCMQSAKEV